MVHAGNELSLMVFASFLQSQGFASHFAGRKRRASGRVFGEAVLQTPVTTNLKNEASAPVNVWPSNGVLIHGKMLPKVAISPKMGMGLNGKRPFSSRISNDWQIAPRCPLIPTGTK
jgi:hypothetical protein